MSFFYYTIPKIEIWITGKTFHFRWTGFVVISTRFTFIVIINLTPSENDGNRSVCTQDVVFNQIIKTHQYYQRKTYVQINIYQCSTENYHNYLNIFIN